MMNDIPVMLTIREVSEKSGLPYSAIRKKCLCGEITFIKSGKKYLINWNRFLEYLNGGREATIDEG